MNESPSIGTLKKVSVLMPAYNAEKYIAASIESILTQTLRDFELIIVDDCSQDSTSTIVQEYAKKDNRIKFYKNEQNLKISKTRNKLISLSNSEYIAWQDADDISKNYRLEAQYNFMMSHPNVGICGGYLEFFNDKKELSIRKYSDLDEILRAKIFRQSPVAQPAAMIRKNILDKVGNFDENLPQAEDLDLSLRIGKISKFSNLKRVVLSYRLHEESITTSKLRENIQCTLFVRRKASRNYGYSMNLVDKIIFIITFCFQFVPKKITYTLFNILRNN